MDEKALAKQNAVIRQRMLDVTEFRVGECPRDSPWLRPARIDYRQDNANKEWDVVRSHDGVAILIFNTTRKKLVLVRQFRPGLLYTFAEEKHGPIDLKNYPPTLGLSLELCAGIADKDKPLIEIARDEVQEECGYDVPVEALKKITTFRYVCTSVSRQTIYYTEVTDDMKKYPGGGAESEGELIEVVEMSIPEVKEYINSEEVQSPASFLFGISWFLNNKHEHCS